MKLRKSDGTKKCISFIWRKQELLHKSEKIQMNKNFGGLFITLTFSEMFYKLQMKLIVTAVFI